jgi:hypothetical protein
MLQTLKKSGIDERQTEISFVVTGELLSHCLKIQYIFDQGGRISWVIFN